MSPHLYKERKGGPATNNPVSFTDPLGLDEEGGGSDTSGGADVGGPGGLGGASDTPCPYNTCATVTASFLDIFVPMISISSSIGGFQVPGETVDVTASFPKGPAANNGRNCTPSPASAGQYVAATAQVAAMTSEFFSGLGPGNLTFGPGSSTSQVMAQSGPVQDVLNSYYMTGQTSGLYTFGGSGYVAAGGNPVAQFVGSFRWSSAPGNGGISLSLTNTTSFRSLTYDMGPQWQRGSFPPMGNTHQTYNITAKCQ